MLRAEGIRAAYGTDEILHGVDIDLHPGEAVALLGPNGSGKTTLLRVLAGSLMPTAGMVQVQGADIRRLSPRERARRVAVLSQRSAAPQGMTALQMVLLGRYPWLGWWGSYSAEDRRIAHEALEETGALPLAGRQVSELSGGELQRVALARALVIEPSVLLFDEPLSNLDAKLRVSMRTEIRRIQQEVGITAIYVTHDQSEAMALSDNIIIMKNGVVEQMGSPQEIYYHPVNEFVADFIGEANFLKGAMTGRSGAHALLSIEGHEMAVAGRDDLKEGETYTVVLRPESGHLADEGGLPCEVIVSCFMGSYQNYHVMVGNTLVKLAEHNPKNKRIYQVGEECHLVFDPEEVHVL